MSGDNCCLICGKTVRNGKIVNVYNTYEGVTYPYRSIAPGVHGGPFIGKVCGDCVKNLSPLSPSRLWKAYREYFLPEGIELDIVFTDGKARVRVVRERGKELWYYL